MARTAHHRQSARHSLRRRRRCRARRIRQAARGYAAQPVSHDSPASDRSRRAVGTDLPCLHVDAQHSLSQVRRARSQMARTKTKPNPYQAYEDALRKKQHELLDSYERDRAAGNAQPDDGIQDLADKAASAYSKELNFSLS